MEANHRNHIKLPRLGLALISILITASAALAVEGRVVRKEDGTPVANAQVTIIGRAVTTRTDENGVFSLAPDLSPPFEVFVSLPGGRYMKPVLIQSIPADGIIVLEVTPLVTASVTVTAGVAPDIPATPASAMTTIPETEIEIRQPINLTQALETVPGVFSVSEGQAAVPAIRGLAQGRSLILIDGTRVTSERRVGPSATYLDPFLLEALEVSRGPGSVAYGSDAFGGVILARTRRPQPGGPLRFRYSGTAGLGIPQLRSAIEISQGVSRNGGFILQGHYRKFEDYSSPQGDVFNSGSSDHGFAGRFEQVFHNGLLSVGWQSDFGRSIERPRTNSTRTRFYYPTEDSHRFTASYKTGPIGGFSSLGLETFIGSNRVVSDQDTFATETAPRSSERSDVAAKDFSVRATAAHPLGNARVEFGLDLNGRYGLDAKDVYFDFDMAGIETSRLVVQAVEDARRIDTGFFATLETELNDVVFFEGGLRADRVTTRNTGGYFGDLSTANHAVSGNASLTFGSFRGFSFTGQVARGFRDARLSDRYYRGITGRGFITGNPDLAPETSVQFDGVVRYAASRWRWAAYVYEYRIHDLIERYESETDFFFFRNRGRARLRGFELETQGDLGYGIALEIGGQVTRGRALDDNTPLDNIGPESLWLQARKNLGRGFAQIRASFYGRQQYAGPTEVETPSYQLLDAAFGWKLGSVAELRLMFRNLLNEEYPLSADRRSPLAPGRSAILTLLVDYGFR